MNGNDDQISPYPHDATPPTSLPPHSTEPAPDSDADTAGAEAGGLAGPDRTPERRGGGEPLDLTAIGAMITTTYAETGSIQATALAALAAVLVLVFLRRRS